MGMYKIYLCYLKKQYIIFCYKSLDALVNFLNE